MPNRKRAAVQAAELEVTGELTVSRLWNRVLTSYLDEYARLDRQGITGSRMVQELDDFMEKLSDTPISTLARKQTTVAYSEGRNSEILSLSDVGEARFVVRSELLDTNTCEVCESLDGTVYEIGSPEYDEFEPPSKCLGEELCRGDYVVIPT